MFKKIVVSLSLVAMLVSPSLFMTEVVNAESNTQLKISDEKLKERLSKIHQASEQAYLQVIKEHTKEKKALLNKFGKKDFSELNSVQKEKMRELEIKKMEQANKEVERIMLKNGYEKVESNDTGGQFSIMADSSDISLFDSLYYDNNYGVYSFIGSWNFIDGTWSKYNDAYDLAAFRALNAPSSILSSVGVAYDHFGNYNGSLVTKRFEDTHGVVFNVEDTYMNPPSAPDTMLTDNGRITVDFRDYGYNKFFLDYEHNYQKYSWSGSATFSGINLTGSSLTVSYTKSNYNWLRTSAGEIIN